MSSHKDYSFFLGIDEVGRGPLAGPVSVAIFVVSKSNYQKVRKALLGITDSKQLSETKRIMWFSLIKALEKRGLLKYQYSCVSATVIEKKGIICAINIALKRSLFRLKLPIKGSFISLDGGLSAPQDYPQETIIKGDQTNWLISTASVIAKVLRDEKMKSYAKKYPHYAFERNKGYGTKEHYRAIKEHGVTELHRVSWIKK